MTPSVIAFFGGLVLGTTFGYALCAAMADDEFSRLKQRHAALLADHERMMRDAEALRRRSALRLQNVVRKAGA